MDSALQDIHCYLEQWQQLCYCQLTLGIMQTSSAKLQFSKSNYGMEHLEISFSRHFLGTTPLTMAVDDSKINLYCGISNLINGRILSGSEGNSPDR